LKNDHHKHPEEYERMVDGLDDRERARIVEGVLLPENGAVFHAFVPDHHIRAIPAGAKDVTRAAIARRFDGIPLARVGQVLICADYNWAEGRPMSWTIWRAFERVGTPKGYAWWIVGEIVNYNVDLTDQIQSARQWLAQRLGGGAAVPAHVIGDASTRKMRNSDGGQDEIERVMRAVPEWTYEPAGRTGNPRQPASAAAVNGMLAPARGGIAASWLHVVPTCKHTIESFTDLRWHPNGRIYHGRSPAEDKSHCGDTIRYGAHLFNPVLSSLAELRSIPAAH
jgi:hypothetical protein